MFFLCQKSVIIPFFPPSCFPITMIIIMLAWKSRKSNLSAGRRFDFFITIIYFITSSSTQFLHHPHPDISHHHHNPYHHPQFLPENNEISHLSAVGSNFLRQLVRTVVDCHSIKWTAASIIIIIMIRSMVLILIKIVNFGETLILLVDHMSCLGKGAKKKNWKKT